MNELHAIESSTLVDQYNVYTHTSMLQNVKCIISLPSNPSKKTNKAE